MKVCASCQSSKPLRDFYRHPYAADGRQGICKDCHKKRMFDLRRDSPKVRERDRERAKLPHRVAANKANTKSWRERNPEAYRAQNAVNNALRDGRIKREPCAVCDSPDRVHAHHRDYLKPLEVVWLCARCHHRLHSIFPEIGGHSHASSR